MKRRAAAALPLLTFILLANPVAVRASGSTTPLAACGGSALACARTMLNVLNHDRALHHVAPLVLKIRQSKGWGGCVGSLGHSKAMAQTGDIWHDDARFPRASFPRDVCFSHTIAGENVGESYSDNVMSDLRSLDQMMMSEPHSPNVCEGTFNHACNILNPAYHHVGIGVISSGGATWLTEDFTN